MGRARSAAKALEIFKRENENLRAENDTLKKKLAKFEDNSKPAAKEKGKYGKE